MSEMVTASQAPAVADNRSLDQAASRPKPQPSQRVAMQHDEPAPPAEPASGIANKSGSGCCTFARLSDDFTTCRKLSSSNLLVDALAVRPPNTVRTETREFSSATF